MSKKISKMTLRQFHAHGKRTNNLGDKRKAAGEGTWGTLKILGAKSAARKNRLMESRRFARLCDDQELNYLCGLRRKGWKLTRSHILQLIRVDDRRTRRSLAAACAKNSGSTRDLQLAIDRRGLHRSYGGRKQKMPESVDAELLVTNRLLSSLVRWDSVVRSVECGVGTGSGSRVKQIERAKRVPRKQAPSRTITQIRERLHRIAADAYDLCEALRRESENRRTRPQKGGARH